MKRDIQKCAQTRFDLLVIGGGINGAAIAHMAALNGLKTCLLEKDDFASGTSSKSTKIVHGGLRYLENLEFSLVHEALKERTIQLRSAPHLVKPMGFIIPVYKKDARPLWLIKIGVLIYDLLSGKYLIEKRRSLTPSEIEKLVPGIRTEGLLGGVMYYDAQMDDARLVLENVLAAQEKGACVANYVEARELIKQTGKTVGVEAYDKIGKKNFKIMAKRAVVAVGPWTDLFLDKEHAQAPRKVRVTKGIHIVYRGQVADHALLIPAKKEGRIFFVIPWRGNSLIGTTDTDFSGDPDKISATEEDIAWLFEEARRVFPSVDFRKEDIITTFAGLRPLAFEEGSPSKVSRQHRIEESYSGVVYVYGGKYTTYRKIAEDTLRKIVRKELVDTSEAYPLYGSGVLPDAAMIDEAAARYGIGRRIVAGLISVYGSRYTDVLALLEDDPSLAEPIIPDSETIRAQVLYAFRTEMALTAEDVMARRLGLMYEDIDAQQCRVMIDEFLKRV